MTTVPPGVFFLACFCLINACPKSDKNKEVKLIPQDGEVNDILWIDINKVEEWYNYFETQRLIVPFTGKDLQDPEFLSYLYEVFNRNPEVFLKTKKKDFNGIIDLTELFDKNSDLRKAISYHEDEEFILSEKVEVNQDELGQEEYRVFIYKNRIIGLFFTIFCCINKTNGRNSLKRNGCNNKKAANNHCRRLVIK